MREKINLGADAREAVDKLWKTGTGGKLLCRVRGVFPWEKGAKTGEGGSPFLARLRKYADLKRKAKVLLCRVRRVFPSKRGAKTGEG